MSDEMIRLENARQVLQRQGEKLEMSARCRDD